MDIPSGLSLTGDHKLVWDNKPYPGVTNFHLKIFKDNGPVAITDIYYQNQYMYKPLASYPQYIIYTQTTFKPGHLYRVEVTADDGTLTVVMTPTPHCEVVLSAGQSVSAPAVLAFGL